MVDQRALLTGDGVYTPDWEMPSEGESGRPVPLSLKLAESSQAVLVVHSFSLYSTGLRFSLHLQLKEGRQDPFILAELSENWSELEESCIAAGEGLRWGLEVGATLIIDARDAEGGYTGPVGEDGQPMLPVLTPGGGWGDESQAVREFWLWGVSAERLAIFCEWPRFGIFFQKAAVPLPDRKNEL
ncbi:hypothetical protein [Kineosporia babensis]|uniref:Uncharacterized protein n=1 Tax=Kineosporia babensis TaxID=499548 RepID=A0A9X1SUN1_9ACTN|nr:hypothetical protein [Kineosporia babensis]MCD5313152.1 hypothetical protein [Kineosporia babensis]